MELILKSVFTHLGQEYIPHNEPFGLVVLLDSLDRFLAVYVILVVKLMIE